ncbi:tRNA glutamyl-Q(34) synthetase GluQRS [Massilia sp. Dwa41.01b]|uniref:tRNA glutamyl-Q(34) synthetase GluQRS n=1 Tax=Massilia sp. Dwa41.01b TaxID=2709302 RepID=UPI001601D57F|nr:tRNA glutamyl-Q(34) synthetase GluQRS [Massilia sp. Dwa41.01b]QNA89831.1 tRNA glutamyl-Q(34) synthetase GluQRS [Massilia sp. Dwa41.01b]
MNAPASSNTDPGNTAPGTTETSPPAGGKPYVGRFAPSPTGRLHAGSLVAAVASYLDARAHGGEWLVRIEDIDEGRSVPGADEAILSLLASLGMESDREVVWQSRRKPLYEAAARQLDAHAYPCGCNRREIIDSRPGVGPDGAAIYPGTCRHGLAPGRSMRSLRLRVPDAGADTMSFHDRFAGTVSQQLAFESGDFVLKRADGYWAYQLAVVVDDADQGVTDIVRGADLIDSTARQIYLQRLLGVPTPRYLHVPVVRNANGEKLSKQTGALAVLPGDEPASVEALLQAAQFLGLQLERPGSLASFWRAAIPAWSAMLAEREGRSQAHAV